MYPIEKKKEAIKPWLKYDKSISAVVRVLPWLNKRTLRRWTDDYKAGKRL